MNRIAASLLLSTALCSAASAQSPSPARMGLVQGPPSFLEVLRADGIWTPANSGGVRILNLDPNGEADNTALINSALASSSQKWYIPKGVYKISDELTGQLGGSLLGDGAHSTIFAIDSTTFNMSARGAIYFPPTGGQSFTLMDVGFEYTQPQTSSRGSLVHFPPAIYAQNAGRMKLERIYFGAPDVCLDARGNAGGAYIHDIECGALTMGMKWDGSFDTVRIDNWHHWTFGNVMIGFTPLHNLYSDGNTGCFDIGRIDGLAATNWGCFQASGHFSSNAANGLTLQFANLSMDGYSAKIIQDAGFVQISGGYTTAGSDTGGSPGSSNTIQLNGGRLEFVNWDLNGGPLTVPAALVTGGVMRVVNSAWSQSQSAGKLLSVTGGTVRFINGLLQCNGTRAGTCVDVSGGTAWLDDVQLSCTSGVGISCGNVSSGLLSIKGSAMSPVFGTPWTAPFINQSGGFLRFNGNYFTIVGNGEGVHFTTDGDLNSFSENTLDGWTYTLPASSVLGDYGFNLVAATLVTPKGINVGGNITTGGAIRISRTNPTVQFLGTGQGTDQKNWDFYEDPSTGDMAWRSLSDDYLSGVQVMSVLRNGSWNAPTVTFNFPVTFGGISASSMAISAASPTFSFKATGSQPVDQKNWDFFESTGANGDMVFRALNDAYSANTPFLTFTRGTGYSLTGAKITSGPPLNAPSYQAAGVAGFSGTKTAGACTFTLSGGIVTNVAGC